MAGRLYRMAKVVSANPKSWGIVDANEISGFKRVAKLSDLYSIAECILSSSYGDGVTDGADAVGQIWHVSETNGDYKLTNWASRKSAAGWTKLSYGGDVSVPVKDVQVTKDGTTASVLSNGIAKIDLEPYAKTNQVTQNLKNYITQDEKGVRLGVAPLDREEMIPLKYLGHLDTTVYKVLGTNEALPTTGIKSCIYLKLIETGNPTGDNNKYAEYVYTGDIKGTYDATKWEKLGEVAAKTDLSEYYKKTEVDSKLTGLARTLTSQDVENFTITPSSRGEQGVGKLYYMQASITRKGGDPLSATIPCVVSAADTTNANAGLMSPADKQKLDGIAVNANNYTHPSYTSTPTKALYKINVDNLGHVSGTAEVTEKDITDLGIPGSIKEASFNTPYTVIGSNSNNELFNLGDAVQVSKDDSETALIVAGGHGIIAGTADKAKADADGKIISTTYWKKTDLVALTDGELNEILK